MIVYAVELEMDAALREEYLGWLRGHALEMLALPGFESAEILQPLDPAPPAGRFVVAVHYRLTSRPAWQAYVERHAPRMREAGLRRFGDRVRASRRLLEDLS
jgi:Domain of unknown function (DUF4286)